MPELPEVETIRRGLEPVIGGRRIRTVTLAREGLRRPFPPDMARRLAGRRIDRLARRSKYLLADLDSGETLLIHLGMSGRILIAAQGDGAHPTAAFHHSHDAAGKHDHVILSMDDGVTLRFNDPRRFGAMDLIGSAELERHPLLAHLGPEPLGNGFNAPYLQARLAGRRSPIKNALLDQRIVAGLGNIYVSEALHRAGIHPRRAAGQIAAARIAALVPIIRTVLEEALEAGGSSLRDYRRADGELGYFQHAFRVYGREGEGCVLPRCDGTVLRITQSGRSSFYCSRCQR